MDVKGKQDSDFQNEGYLMIAFSKSAGQRKHERVVVGESGVLVPINDAGVYHQE